MKKKNLFIMLLVTVFMGSFIYTMNAANNANSKPEFVSVLPKLKQTFSGVTIKLGAKATGTPTPTYVWYKNDYTIVSGDKYSISENDGYVELTIKNAQPGDSGKYKVVATNSIGIDYSTCDVVIVTKR